MLSSINLCMPQSPAVNPSYERNEKEDLKIALDYLWDFKEKLSKLHPNVMYTIERMLQNNYR